MYVYLKYFTIFTAIPNTPFPTIHMKPIVLQCDAGGKRALPTLLQILCFFL